MRARRGVGIAAGLMTALAFSSCSNGAATTASDPGASAADASAAASPAPIDGTEGAAADTGSATGKGGTGAAQGGPGQVVVADPAHAVPPPGPRGRNEAIAPPDVMVYNADEPLSDEVVEEISDLDGVETVSRLSMAQVSLENRVYTVAAVDPGSYRLFTDPRSAEFQEQWDRVAGGEVALTDDKEVRERLPIDDDGYLRLSVGDATGDIHVGAIAPQVIDVDAVVNVKWGAELGIPAGNALMVRTGTTSPQSLRPKITRIVGGSATIQDVDVVAREGLDPNATQTAFTVGGASAAIGTFRYTAIGGGRIQPEQSWVDSHISTEEVPILGTVTCNRFIMPQLRAALTEVVTRGLADKINPGEYAGCYYPRFIAGSTTLSNHSFGTALDLNVPGNLRGTVGEMDRDVVAIFKKWGFAWGGDWGYTDPMHFEADRIVDPR